MLKTHTRIFAMRSQAARLVAVTSVSSTVLRYVLLMLLQYATAMFKVLYSFSGWQNANYVLNDVQRPVRTLKIAGPLALGITATLYIFANIAYFAFVLQNVSDKLGPMTSPTAHRRRQTSWSLKPPLPPCSLRTCSAPKRRRRLRYLLP